MASYTRIRLATIRNERRKLYAMMSRTCESLSRCWPKRRRWTSRSNSQAYKLSLPARKKNLSNRARHRELFEHLLTCSDQVRAARVSTRTLFSANYYAAFFNYALAHVAATSAELFNFVAASRIEKTRQYLTNLPRP
jgi:dTDP-4-amino-4,6-dideoxygalactose transaminase